MTAGNQTIESFDVSPDGQWLAYDSDRGGIQQVYRVRLTGGEPEQITTDSADHFWPAFSPDGRRIAFHAFREGHRQIFLVPADGGSPVQVTRESTDMRAPRWGPDGRHLLVGEDRGARFRLNVVTEAADGSWSEPKPLAIGDDPATGRALARNFDQSPDGRFILCDCEGLTLVPAQGGPPRQLLPVPASAVVDQAAWSADSRLIYYLYQDSAALTLRSIPAAGGAPRILVRFDDPSRPWHRFGFRARGGRFYFTLGDLQSNIWVADMR